jgi:hypothetical protein
LNGFLFTDARSSHGLSNRFWRKPDNYEVPEKITLEGNLAPHQAIAELKAEGVLPDQTLVRTNGYVILQIWEAVLVA